MDKARGHQDGRVSSDDTAVSFSFTEYWFRTSGLYDLDAEWQAEGEDEQKHAQLRFMEWFCKERGCDVPKSQIERKVNELKRVADQLETFDAEVSGDQWFKDRDYPHRFADVDDVFGGGAQHKGSIGIGDVDILDDLDADLAGL